MSSSGTQCASRLLLFDLCDQPAEPAARSAPNPCYVIGRPLPAGQAPGEVRHNYLLHNRRKNSSRSYLALRRGANIVSFSFEPANLAFNPPHSPRSTSDHARNREPDFTCHLFVQRPKAHFVKPATRNNPPNSLKTHGKYFDRDCRSFPPFAAQ